MDRSPSIVYVSTPSPDSDEGLQRVLHLSRATGARLRVLSTDEARGQPVGSVEAALGGVSVELRLLPRDLPVPTGVLRALPEETTMVAKVAGGIDPSAGERADSDRVLLRALPCSLLLMPAGKATRSRVVLAAVDLRDDGEGVDRAVIRMAAALAEGEGAHVHIVHAWSLTGESIVACPVRGIGPARARDVLARLREERVSDLKALMHSEGVGHVGWTLGKGLPSQVIRKAVRRTGADLLVTGYRGRKGLWGFVQGNLAESFLDIPGLSFLFVRPTAPALKRAPESARTA